MTDDEIHSHDDLRSSYRAVSKRRAVSGQLVLPRGVIVEAHERVGQLIAEISVNSAFVRCCVDD